VNQLGTKQNSTSGTSLLFGSIPAGVTKVSIGFSNVSTSGSSDILLVLGDSDGLETSGYTGANTRFGPSTLGSTQFPTSGLIVCDDVASGDTYSGIVDLMLVDPSTNTWVMKSAIAKGNVRNTQFSAGNKALSNTLTQLQIKTENGTDTFDGGMINIWYSS
jgi:hypothetical protein